VDAGFGPRNTTLHKHPIYTLASHPNLIIRPYEGLESYDYYRGPFGDVEPHTHQENIARGLNYLDEEYGLHTPGLSMAREYAYSRTKESHGGQTEHRYQPYVLANRIEGIPFFPERLHEIPESITTNAFSEIIRYHEDMLTKSGYYLEDVRLPQLMWGKGPGDQEKKVYFIDVESIPDVIDNDSSITASKGPYFLSAYAQYNGMMLTRDLIALETAYGKRYSQLRTELGKLFLDYIALDDARTSAEGAFDHLTSHPDMLPEEGDMVDEVLRVAKQARSQEAQ